MTYKLAGLCRVGVMVGFRLAGQTGKAVGYDRYTLAGSGLHIGCRSRTPSRKIPRQTKEVTIMVYDKKRRGGCK